MNSPDITYLDLSFAVIRLVQSITIAYILLATFFDSVPLETLAIFSIRVAGNVYYIEPPWNGLINSFSDIGHS